MNRTACGSKAVVTDTANTPNQSQLIFLSNAAEKGDNFFLNGLRGRIFLDTSCIQYTILEKIFFDFCAILWYDIMG